MIGLLKTAASLVGSAAAVAVLLGLVVKALQSRASRATASESATSRSAARGF